MSSHSDSSLSVFRYASAVTDGSQYFILLIISDGVITDMAQTKESIVNVKYPFKLSALCVVLVQLLEPRSQCCGFTDSISTSC